MWWMIWTYYVGKKIMKKMHHSWIYSYFSASERSIPILFPTMCQSTVFHSQSKKRFTTSAINIRVRIFEFKKYHFSKWLTLQLKALVLRKGTMKTSQRCGDSLSKNIYRLFNHRNFDFTRSTIKDIRGQNIHECEKNRPNDRPRQPRKWLCHWGFPQFLGANINHLDGMEMPSIVVEVNIDSSTILMLKH